MIYTVIPTDRGLAFEDDDGSVTTYLSLYARAYPEGTRIAVDGRVRAECYRDITETRTGQRIAIRRWRMDGRSGECLRLYATIEQIGAVVEVVTP